MISRSNPLVRGYSREAISANVSREMHRGRPQDQALAIALATARRAFRERFPGRRLPAYLRRNPSMPHRGRRHRNPTHYDWLDLLLPIGLVYLLIRSGRVQVGG
jgi:hypothetical protein